MNLIQSAAFLGRSRSHTQASCLNRQVAPLLMQRVMVSMGRWASINRIASTAMTSHPNLNIISKNNIEQSQSPMVYQRQQ